MQRFSDKGIEKQKITHHVWSSEDSGTSCYSSSKEQHCPDERNQVFATQNATNNGRLLLLISRVLSLVLHQIEIIQPVPDPQGAGT